MSEREKAPIQAVDGIHAETRIRDQSFVMNGHHCHTCYELFYVENGACRFLINDHIYDLHAGDFILVPPMLLHYTRYLFGACKRTVILFRHEDLPPAVEALMPHEEHFFSEMRIFQVPEAHRVQIASCTQDMAAEDKIQDARSSLMRRILLHRLLLLCGRFCILISGLPADIHTTDPQIMQAAQYIGTHYMAPITTADVAAAVGFSPNYLSRKFRQEAGIGLHEYLVFVRLHHAALELLSTRDSIITIALRCGFSDSNYFKDSFKKKYGVTPRNYRKLN